MPRNALIVAIVLALGVPVMAAEPAANNGTISIMKPEQGAPATQNPRKARRGSSNPVYPIPLPGPQTPQPVPRIQAGPPPPQTPPPLYVPQTGRLVPNQPAIGSGPGGRETFQDRSARCVHQSGVNAATAGDPGTYIRGCINQ
jgi:hypothetical protein